MIFFNFFTKIFFFLTHDTDDTVNRHLIEAHRMERIPCMDTFIIHQMAYLLYKSPPCMETLLPLHLQTTFL